MSEGDDLGVIFLDLHLSAKNQEVDEATFVSIYSSGSIDADDRNGNENEESSRSSSSGESLVVQAEEPWVSPFSTQLYNFSKHLAEYIRLYQDTNPQIMCARKKYYICTEQNGVGCLDLLFASFCEALQMKRIKNLPSQAGERVFCWLGRRKAREILPMLRPNHHIINRLPLDIYLKDKQSLAWVLKSNAFGMDICYPAHRCKHQGGSWVPFQQLCPHQYVEHSFQRCHEPGCFQNLLARFSGIHQLHPGDFCQCFKTMYFVPETRVFASSVQQDDFINEVSELAPNSQWIVKPSYMRSSRGIRVLSSAEQLRAFLKVEPCNRFMWGQDYIVQRYIKKPMLTTSGQKFDVRMFLLIVVCGFWRVLGFLHPGYVRKVPNAYREMAKGDVFEAATHLANTRVWVRATAAANPVDTVAATQTQSDDPVHEIIEVQKGKRDQQQRQSSAVLDKPVMEAPPEKAFEPLPRTGFLLESLESDECEEYNYAVRHGCLKNNTQNLPLLTGAIRIPGASHMKVPSMGAARTKDPAPTLTAEKDEGPDSEGVRDAGLEGELLEPFTTNKEFIKCLQVMVTRICCSISDQVKSKSNCYQLYSLDICIDENGKPWLLEVNPTIITEDVNWNSVTIRHMVPSVLVESLSLANECIQKSINFLALRTPLSHTKKPNDLVFRQNFLWMYSTPASHCQMCELKRLKYSIESAFRAQLVYKGIVYRPVDYYPKRNSKFIPKSRRFQFLAVNSSAAGDARCAYRFPSPVASIPVLEEDVAFSTRYKRLQPDCIGRQCQVRRMQRETVERTVHNKQQRYAAYQDKREASKMYKRQRFKKE